MRDTLPEHHQKLLEERLSRMVNEESALQERIGAWKAEERERHERLETLHADAVREAGRLRERLMADVAHER